MELLNTNLIKDYLTNNHSIDDNGNVILEPVKYRWTHGATDLHLGDGLMIYSLIQFIKAKTCVCIGTGGGFIPRLMTQSRMDLWSQGIFKGNNQLEWGDIGTTIIIDAANGVGGFTDWTDDNSFLRKHFSPQVILETSERAFYDYFIRQDIKIDYLHIDGDHSYEGLSADIINWLPKIKSNGIIAGHDYTTEYKTNVIKAVDEYFGKENVNTNVSSWYVFMKDIKIEKYKKNSLL